MLSTFSQFSPQGLLPQFPLSGPMNPFLQNHFGQGPYSPSPFAGNGVADVPVQHIGQTLAQLAQQIAVQSAVAQQIAVAVHQLAHQLAAQGLQGYAAQGLQGYPGGSFLGGQAFAGAGQPFGGGIAQPFGQTGYGGFNPQAQGWGTHRQQTIQ